jgi:hypothetical protein
VPKIAQQAKVGSQLLGFYYPLKQMCPLYTSRGTEPESHWSKRTGQPSRELSLGVVLSQVGEGWDIGIHSSLSLSPSLNIYLSPPAAGHC